LRVLGLSVLAAALLFTGYTGLVEGFHATRFAATRGMRVATAAQLLYGGCAVAALIALAVKRQWVFGLLVAWAVGGAATAGLAPVVYAGQPIGTGLLTALASGLLLGLAAWGWRRCACQKKRPNPQRNPA
jgi:hypothetical protein